MISIIVPFHNEKENLKPLYWEIKEVLAKTDFQYEIIFVDDGSTDGSGAEADEIGAKDNGVKIVRLPKRFGKGKALSAGIDKAKGETLIFMDADLQDNPADIIKFLEKINQGYDLVNGVRKIRKENPIIKIYSKVGNQFLKTFSKSPFADINCGFKALRRKVLNEIALYGNNFRFLPLAAFYQGFRVTEIEVNNRSRRYGKSKFGISKPFIGLIDTITAYFLYKFSEKPLHFFGTIGGIFFTTGFITALILSVEKIFFGVLLYRRPALLLAILLIIVGIQITMTGIIGELIVYQSKRKNK